MSDGLLEQVISMLHELLLLLCIVIDECNWMWLSYCYSVFITYPWRWLYVNLLTTEIAFDVNVGVSSIVTLHKNCLDVFY
jgi:hypothetical protein